MLIAGFLGSGWVADAFIVAFRLPNLLRRLFGEGTLAAVIVPIFSHAMVKHGPERGQELGRGLLKTGALILAALTGIALIAAPDLILLTAPGFHGWAAKFDLSLNLARIMLPYLLFIGMSALAMGILNSYGHFIAPALAPAILNLVMIVALVVTAAWWSSPAMCAIGLAAGVLVGGGLQFGIQIPALARRGLLPLRGSRFWPAEIRRISARLVPTLVGAAGYQINLVVSTLYASLLPVGSISALYYADRLVQMPLGIFVVALATACLPAFSRQAASQATERLAAATSQAVAMSLFLTLPAMVGLIVLREPIVQMIFQRGAFDYRAAQLTADAVLYYAMGLSALAVVRMTNTTFFALQEMRIPLQAALVSVGLNCGLGWVLKDTMGHSGLALAAGLAAVVNCVWLLVGVGLRLAGVFSRKFWFSIAKAVLATGLMGFSVGILRDYVMINSGSSAYYQAGATLICIVWGMLCYGGLAKLFKCPELPRLTALAGVRSAQSST